MNLFWENKLLGGPSKNILALTYSLPSKIAIIFYKNFAKFTAETFFVTLRQDSECPFTQEVLLSTNVSFI